MLLIAALVGLFAYDRMTSAWSVRPFLVIAAVVAALIVLAVLMQPGRLPLMPLLFSAVIDYLVGVAIFAAGFALGRWLDRNKYA